MRHALVTGASGFLGRHLVPELRARDVKITTVGRTANVDGHHIALGPGPWHPSALAAIIEAEEPDIIFHLAGSSVGSSQELDELNWGVATSLMQALSVRPARPVFVCCGSAAEYGAAIVDGAPITEDVECLPLSAYGISKLAQTRSALSFSEATGTPVLVARIFNPIGAGMPTHLALADFAWQIAASSGPRAVLQCGNLDVYRDFVDVRDVASMICGLAANPLARGVINICSGQAVGLRDLVHLLVEASGKEIVVETAPQRLRPGELQTVLGSTARIEKLAMAPPKTDYAAAVGRVWSDVKMRHATVLHA